MKLNHINLVVSDLSNTINLFETHFNFKCEFIKGDNAIAVLTGEDAFSLVIMASKNTDITYPEAFHIGFMLPDEAEVNNCYRALKASGVEVGKEPRSIRNSFGFYFTFDSLTIEVGYIS